MLRFPAIAEEDEIHVIRSLGKPRTIIRKAGEALHPDREPLQVLKQLREILGEYNFAGQYQQAPAPLEGGMVKRSWFKTYAPHELPATFDYMFQSWDTANKSGEVKRQLVCKRSTIGRADESSTGTPSFAKRTLNSDRWKSRRRSLPWRGYGV